MSYTPTEWVEGDTITAEKLNKLEGGVEAASVLLLNATDSGSAYTLDKTFSEISDAFDGGASVIVRLALEDAPAYTTVVLGTSESEGEYKVFAWDAGAGGGKIIYSASTEEDYPAYVYD